MSSSLPYYMLQMREKIYGGDTDITSHGQLLVLSEQRFPALASCLFGLLRKLSIQLKKSNSLSGDVLID